MKSILAMMTFVSVSAFAGPTIFKVKGMHCSSCAKMINKSICDDAEIKKTYGGCTAKTVDEKNEMGKITFAQAGETKVDQEKIQAMLTKVDEGYKIVPADAPVVKPAAKTKKK